MKVAQKPSRVPRGFADMSWSPCAEFGNGGAIPASCLSGPFLVSRFCCVPSTRLVVPRVTSIWNRGPVGSTSQSDELVVRASNKKPDLQGRASSFQSCCQLLRWRDLRYITFERLVCFFDEVGVDRPNFGRLGNIALVGVLEVNLLELHRLRCAVYTRKSSEHGLEQDFNSLDAQRVRRQMCPLYVSGLIGPGDRKSIQPMAERHRRTRAAIAEAPRRPSGAGGGEERAGRARRPLDNALLC